MRLTLGIYGLAMASATTCGTDGAAGGACAVTKALLQRGRDVRDVAASASMRSDDVASAVAAYGTGAAGGPAGGPPRNELWNLQVPLSTDYSVPGIAEDHKHFTDHQKCNSNSPDGRLFFCGENHKYVRYFKFESMTFTDQGLPVFNDSTWSLWKEFLPIWRPWRATLCFPNWKKPFEVLPNGNHLYVMYSTSDQWRSWLNVTIAKPMTPEAEIVDVARGDHEKIANVLPRYGTHTGDGLLYIGTNVSKGAKGNLVYTALPADGEACGLDFPPFRPLHELPMDPDGLNLPARYPFARRQFKDDLGKPITKEHQGTYCWIDPEGRNLWYGGPGGVFRVMGEDTGGMEVLIDGGFNQVGSRKRWMSSLLWNFESERTAAHRFPGELHTSGVGSGAKYQLPMSKGHHVLPMFAAWEEYYAEVELFNAWKSPHWDIVFLPMTSAIWQPRYTDRNYQMIPDISRNYLLGEMRGSVGSSLQFDGGDGAVVVDLSHAVDVAAVTSPVRSFTAQLAFKTFWSGQNNALNVLHHPNITLRLYKNDITWTFSGQTVHGGNYEQNKWFQVALVFDGVDQTVTSYMNGIEVTTESTSFNTFQLGTEHPLIIGNENEDPSVGRGLAGLIDNVRLMAHARSQRNVCKSAFGSQCGGAISYHPTSTQYELSMQIKECSPLTMHTLACSSAIHRVCANLDAMKQKEAGVSNDALGALTPPGPPVSMGGVVVALGAETVDVACTPNDHHLSVPVDWWTMEKHNENCTHMTDHSSVAIFCNLASHGFCTEAAAHLNSSLTTGIIFEADARAWVTCFEATAVVTEPNLPGCADLASTSCQEEVSALCSTRGHGDGGVLQKVGDMLELTRSDGDLEKAEVILPSEAVLQERFEVLWTQCVGDRMSMITTGEGEGFLTQEKLEKETKEAKEAKEALAAQAKEKDRGAPRPDLETAGSAKMKEVCMDRFLAAARQLAQQPVSRRQYDSIFPNVSDILAVSNVNLRAGQVVVVRYRLAGACNFWHPKHRVLKDEREPLPWPVPNKVQGGEDVEGR
eukprot:s1329_g17.t2